MRIGVLFAEMKELDWAAKLGFRSVEWMRFADSPAAPPHADWKPFAEKLRAECQSRDIRISAIGAFYRNPLDRRQSENAAAIIRRAIEVAEHIGVRTVAGFAGGIVETEINERGGNPVYKPLENYMPKILEFWEPLAWFAADRGVRIAFENCPQGTWRLPVMNYNIFGQPAMWERFFNTTKCDNIGLEWDPSHLICQLIDPVANLRKFGSRIYHVHAKDAWIDRALMETYGICHPGVTEHRFPGLGQANWAEIVRALLLAGYDSDLNIEGWHDPVYRNHGAAAPDSLRGKKLEDTGLLIAKKTLEQLIAGTD
jgi:sugar phosphate isomerase/epimerase